MEPSSPTPIASTEGTPLSGSLHLTQDVVGDLDLFVRLAQAGHFDRAQAFFDEALKYFETQFPVLAEYADILIERGAFRQAKAVLDSALANLNWQELRPHTYPALFGSDDTQDEYWVLQLLRGLAALNTEPAEEPTALAQICLDRLQGQRLRCEDLTPVLTQILILSLRTIAFVSPSHDGSKKEPRLPLVFPSAVISQLDQFVFTTRQLIKYERHAAAGSILSIYLHCGEGAGQLAPEHFLQLLPSTTAVGDTSLLLSQYTMMSTYFETQLFTQYERLVLPANVDLPPVCPARSPESLPLVESKSTSQLQGPSNELGRATAATATHNTLSAATSSGNAQVGPLHACGYFSPPRSGTVSDRLGVEVIKALQGDVKNTEMHDIMDPVSTSRAYCYLELAKWDQELFESVTGTNLPGTNSSDGLYTSPANYHTRLDHILHLAEEHHDLKLLADVLWRRLATMPEVPDEEALKVRSLWEGSGNSLECIKLLACLGVYSRTPTGLAETLLEEIYVHDLNRSNTSPNDAEGRVLCTDLSEHLPMYNLTPVRWQVRLAADLGNVTSINDFPHMVAAWLGSYSFNKTASWPEASLFERHVRLKASHQRDYPTETSKSAAELAKARARRSERRRLKGMEPLLIASAEGQQAVVQVLLARGADVNMERGLALRRSSQREDSTMVRILLEHGADPDARGGRSEYALLAASERGDMTIVRLLLEHGATVNMPPVLPEGNPLYLASHRGHEAVVRLLLEHGADVNAYVGGHVPTALVAASSRGSTAVVRLLLEHGAAVNDHDAFRDAYAGYRTPNRVLPDSSTAVRPPDPYFDLPALLAASERGHEEVVRQLLAHGAEVNARASWGTNALQAASTEGHEAVVRQLLENGADVNARAGGLYCNALIAGCVAGHEGIVRLLLDHGADINARGEAVANAVHAARQHGHLEILRLLLERDAADTGEFGGARAIAE
ncbi:hypothetical protein LTR17_013338 [Elasticomyces elasticus]|nr:hypothetical protein LTR17_013338 [Elasticomyces elasticus]